jgi:hypothetical protein
MHLKPACFSDRTTADILLIRNLISISLAMLKSQMPESCEAEKTELDDGVTRTFLSANVKAKSKAADGSVLAT